MARPTKRNKQASKQQAFAEREAKRKAELREQLKITYGGLARIAR